MHCYMRVLVLGDMLLVLLLLLCSRVGGRVLPCICHGSQGYSTS